MYTYNCFVSDFHSVPIEALVAIDASVAIGPLVAMGALVPNGASVASVNFQLGLRISFRFVPMISFVCLMIPVVSLMSSSVFVNDFRRTNGHQCTSGHQFLNGHNHIKTNKQHKTYIYICTYIYIRGTRNH